MLGFAYWLVTGTEEWMLHIATEADVSKEESIERQEEQVRLKILNSQWPVFFSLAHCHGTVPLYCKTPVLSYYEKVTEKYVPELFL